MYDKHKQLIKIIFFGILTMVFDVALYHYIYAPSTYAIFKNSFQDFFNIPDMAFWVYVGITTDIFIIWLYIVLEIYISRVFFPFTGLKRKRKQNMWKQITFLLILLVIVIGYFFLYAFSSHDLSSILHDVRTDTVVGEMNCTDSSGHFLVNSLVTCDVQQPSLHSISANITFTMDNGTAVPGNFNSNMTFYSIPNVKHIFFSISGLDKNNNVVKLTTGRDFQFYTQDEYAQTKGQFITYFAGILIVTFVTIPSTMANFKKIFEK